MVAVVDHPPRAWTNVWGTPFFNMWVAVAPLMEWALKVFTLMPCRCIICNVLLANSFCSQTLVLVLCVSDEEWGWILQMVMDVTDQVRQGFALDIEGRWLSLFVNGLDVIFVVHGL